MHEITDRDIKAVRLAYRFHFITIEQAATCVFGIRNVAQRRLSAIQKRGYLLSFPLSGVGRGHPTKVYYLNRKLKREIGLMLGEDLDSANIHKGPPDNTLVTRHCLELNTVLAAFVAAARSRELQFRFLTEYWSATSAQKGRVAVLSDETRDPRNRRRRARYRRDAVCSIGTAKGQALFEIEYDRGFEVLKSQGHRKITIARKIGIFLESVKERRFERYSRPAYFNSPFSVSRLLLVTTSEQRLGNIASLCNEINSHGLVYLAVVDRLKPSTVLGPVWSVPESNTVSMKPLVSKP